MMRALEPTADALHPLALPAVPQRALILWSTIVVLIAVFYFVEHGNAQVSNLEAFTITGADMAERVAGGDAGRRLAIPALGLFGVLLLLRREGSRLQIHSRLGWLMLGYLAWCGASTLWSEDPALTVRRFGVLLFCCIGALGLARQLSLRDMCLISLAVTAVLIANSLRTEIVMGTFQPFSADYRFAGTLHPNAQAPYCATMALSAAFLAGGARRGRMFFWALCLVGLGLLVLTKSRTVCGALLLGLVIYSSVGMTWPKKIALATTLLWAGSMLLWVSLLLGWDVERQAVNVVLIGRQEETDSLSGRVPLWWELLPHVQQSPLIGHGYQAFWNAARIESFSRAFQWTVPDGHCAYLDMLLDLGLIGATLCVLTVFTGVSELVRRLVARRADAPGRDFGYGFLFALLACRSVNGILESGFSTPTTLVPFLMVCGLVHLGFCEESEQTSLTNGWIKESMW